MSPAKKKNVAQNHPAETTTLAAAAAALLASLGVNLSDMQLQILIAVLAFIPAAITYWRVTRG